MAYSHNPFSLCYNPITDRMEMFPDAKWINTLILNHTRSLILPLNRIDQEDSVCLEASTQGMTPPGWYKATLTLVSQWTDQEQESYSYFPAQTILLEIGLDGAILRQSPIHGTTPFGCTVQSTPQQIAFVLTSINFELLRGLCVYSLTLERIS